jgi:hypothetical protein
MITGMRFQLCIAAPQHREGESMLGSIVTVWRVMTWDVVLLAILLGGSVLSLAISGAELPYRIQTFGRSSPEEHAFERRATWLRVAGLVSLGAAALLGWLRGYQLLW